MDFQAGIFDLKLHVDDNSFVRQLPDFLYPPLYSSIPGYQPLFAIRKALAPYFLIPRVRDEPARAENRMKIAISIKNLRKTYDNGSEALKGVSLEGLPGTPAWRQPR